MEAKLSCPGRRPVLCLLASSLPTNTVPEFAMYFDIICVKPDQSIFSVLENCLPDLFVSLKPNADREDMNQLPLLLRRMWFTYDNLCQKTFQSIQSVLAKRSLTCYVVTNDKNAKHQSKESMLRFISPQAFVAHHVNNMDINFEFCFFVDSGLENDKYMRQFFAHVWPTFCKLKRFCGERYHQLGNRYIATRHDNQLIFAAMHFLEPLILEPLLIQDVL